LRITGAHQLGNIAKHSVRAITSSMDFWGFRQVMGTLAQAMACWIR